MKFYYLLLFFLLSYSSLFPQWEYQFPPVNGLLISTDFIDSNNGVASGWQFELSSASGRITYTSDGGGKWFLANIPDSSRSITDIQMINPRLGYACGAYNITADYTEKFFNSSEYFYPDKDNLHQWQMFKYALNPDQEDYRGIFLRTTNGGADWTTIGTLPDSIYYLGGLSFLDSLTGYIVSTSGIQNNGKIFKTTNGGMSWVQQTFDDGINFWDIEFISHNQGIAVGYIVPPVGELHGIIYWTENGGEEWHLLDFPEIDNFNHLSFSSLNIAYVTGIGIEIESIVYKTYNGGQSWELTSSTAAGNYFYDGIDFLQNSDEGILYGNTFILDSLGFNHMIPFISKSVDGGYNWYTPIEFDSLLDYLVIGSDLLDEEIWYVCGGRLSNSIVLKTTNGGIASVENEEEIPTNFLLSQNFPNPFNPITTIKYQIPEISFVTLKVYDVLGSEVVTLVNEEKNIGSYEVEFNGISLPSGIYFYRLQAGSFVETKKMVLMK